MKVITFLTSFPDASNNITGIVLQTNLDVGEEHLQDNAVAHRQAGCSDAAMALPRTTIASATPCYRASHMLDALDILSSCCTSFC